ncbi:MAG: copper-binding protein [Burkholderiales bacterium]
MRKLLILACLAIPLSHAADAPMAGHKMQSEMPGKQHEGSGKVIAISRDRITLSHGAIASLNWPPMTMGFALANPGLAKGIAVGDSVRFRFSEQSGQYVVQGLVRQ